MESPRAQGRLNEGPSKWTFKSNTRFEADQSRIFVLPSIYARAKECQYQLVCAGALE
jgi:hypothetical protein